MKNPRLRALNLLAIFLFVLSGCGGEEDSGPSLTIDAAKSADAFEDLSMSDEDASEDVLEAEDLSESESDTEDIAETQEPEEPVLQGIPDGDGLIVQPEMLEGLFVYGIGVDPQSAMAYIGNTPAGALAVAADQHEFVPDDLGQPTVS